MELKLHRLRLLRCVCQRLLIVPYGIETWAYIQEKYGLHILLIVPYGIETAYPRFRQLRYGTFNRTLWN